MSAANFWSEMFHSSRGRSDIKPNLAANIGSLTEQRRGDLVADGKVLEERSAAESE